MPGKICSPRLLQRIVFTFVMMLCIPMTTVLAQDFEAVQKRLLKAVKKDELTLEQAAVMMEVLRELSEEQRYEEEEEHEHWHDEEEEEDERERREVRGREIEMKLREAAEEMEPMVAEGKITREQFNHRLGRYELMLRNEAEKNDEEDERKRYFDQMERRLELAVERERISKEEAYQRLMELKRELWGDEEEGEKNEWTEKDDAEKEEYDERKRAYQEAANRLKKAVDRGRISEEDAKRRMVEIREADEVKRQKYRSAEAKVKEAIETGKISEEAGLRRLDEYKRQLWDVQDHDGDDHEHENEDHEHEHDHDHDHDDHEHDHDHDR